MDPAVIAKRPKVRTCYVCGREYGLSSFEIHLKQCKQMWIVQEEKKPLRERRPVPEPPQVLAESSGDGAIKSAYDLTPAELEAQNRAAAQAFEQKVMEKCPYCGRTFNPERLAIHNRSCTADKPAKAVGQTKPREQEETTPSPTQPPLKPKATSSTKTLSQSGTPDDAKRSSSSEKLPLAGNISSNRKQRQSLQSPLTSDDPSSPIASPRTLKDIRAKLDHWEKVAMTMVSEVQQLKLAIEKMI